MALLKSLPLRRSNRVLAGVVTKHNLYSADGIHLQDGGFLLVGRESGKDATIRKLDAQGQEPADWPTIEIRENMYVSVSRTWVMDSDGAIFLFIGGTLRKFLKSGEVDLSFGDQGKILIDEGYMRDERDDAFLREAPNPRTIAIYGDRIAIVFANIFSQQNLKVAVLKGGKLDKEFGNDGVASISLPYPIHFDQISWLPDASLVVSVQENTPTESFGRVFRLQGPSVNPRPKHNIGYPLNADNDPLKQITPLDVLAIINELNLGPTDELSAQYYCDVDADGSVSPLDALQVINFLNRSNQGEGESMASDERSARYAVFAQWDVAQWDEVESFSADSSRRKRRNQIR